MYIIVEKEKPVLNALCIIIDHCAGDTDYDKHSWSWCELEDATSFDDKYTAQYFFKELKLNKKDWKIIKK